MHYAQFVPSHILLIKLTFTHMLINNLTTGLKRFKILILKKIKLTINEREKKNIKNVE